MKPRVAVVRFPGSNCEYETARALDACGLQGVIFNWNEISGAAGSGSSAWVLPGGFSFQDRVRAGAVAARERIMDVVYADAVSGKPVLGICNGAQILVESGLVPGWRPGAVEASLSGNLAPGRTGYLSRWIFVRAVPEGVDICPWLADAGEEPIPLPIAHAEGRFVFRSADGPQALEMSVLRYCSPEGAPASDWPLNPNGSSFAAAGVMKPRGNVLAMMPHPERALNIHHVPPNLPGPWGEVRRNRGPVSEPGPGASFFRGLARYLEVQ